MKVRVFMWLLHLIADIFCVVLYFIVNRAAQRMVNLQGFSFGITHRARLGTLSEDPRVHLAHPDQLEPLDSPWATTEAPEIR